MAHVERVLQLEEAERRQREAAHAAALRRQEDAVNTPPPPSPPIPIHTRAPRFRRLLSQSAKGRLEPAKGARPSEMANPSLI